MITDKNLITNKHPTDKDTDSLVPKRLEGQVAIITGGARGIGEATVRLFTNHGAKVVIADIEDTLGTALAASLSPPATFIHCDVGLEDDVRHLIDTTVAAFGHLDIIFNNAGILGNQSKPKLSITEFDADEFDRLVAVNVRGTTLGMKHAARVMVPRKRGSIITSASVAGLMGGLGPHGYTATKHAIVGLTKNVGCELGKYGIRVNCISPFGVATWMLVNGWKENDDLEEEEVEKMEEIVSELGSLGWTFFYR